MDMSVVISTSIFLSLAMRRLVIARMKAIYLLKLKQTVYLRLRMQPTYLLYISYLLLQQVASTARAGFAATED